MKVNVKFNSSIFVFTMFLSIDTDLIDGHNTSLILIFYSHYTIDENPHRKAYSWAKEWQGNPANDGELIFKSLSLSHSLFVMVLVYTTLHC